MDSIEEKKLHYSIVNEKAYFYYGDNLIFQNGKSMPFLILKKNIGGIEIVDALDEISIEEKEDCFELTFRKQNIIAKVILKEENHKIKFEIDCDENFDELSFCLYKNQKSTLYGLPFYGENKKSKLLFFKNKKFENNIENKLCFYLSDLYFFENVSITKYICEVKENIYIKTSLKHFSFNIIFAKNIYAAINIFERNNKRINKYSNGTVFLRTDRYNQEEIDKFEEENDVKIKGIIIERELFSTDRIKIEKTKSDKKHKKLIYIINKNIDEKTAKRYFEKNEYTEISDGKYKLSIKNEETARKYLILVRKYLDFGIKGIYFDDDFTKNEMYLIKKGMKTVLREYLNCTIFHSVLCEDTEDFGYYIIKNKDIIKDFGRYSNQFLYSGVYQIGKEDKNLENIKKFAINIVKL